MTIQVFAPAKINLNLHITGRLENGYHTLDSYVAFADIGDRISIEPAGDFSFHITGPFARSFSVQDKDDGIDSRNLVVRAARGLAGVAERDLKVKISLQKNLPVAAGIGGGSSDAAAAIWGLMEVWGIKKAGAPFLPALLKDLGADVPVCFECAPVRMRGIGDVITPAPDMPEIPVVLVNCGKPCETAQVFKAYSGVYGQESMIADGAGRDIHAFVAALAELHNDLTAPAVSVVPEIVSTLDALSGSDGCLLSRMSGSGATCFGLFADEDMALEAAEDITRAHPDWWVRNGVLNRVERY